MVFDFSNMENKIGIKQRNALLNIEHFFFFYNLLLSARATIFTVYLDPRENLIGFSLLVLPMFYLYQKHRIKLNNSHFRYMMIGVTIWIVYHICKDASVKYLEYIMMYIRLFDMYLLVNLFKFKLITYFEKYVVMLTIIALIMWVIMHIIGVDAISQYGFIEPASGTSSASFLVFNAPNMNYYNYEQGLFGLMRNCGFCWEPGLFASFIVLGMVFNILIYKKLFNRNFLILVAGLFTTFSTTGYVAFILLLGLYYLNKYISNWRKAFLKALIFIPLVIAFFQIPFMQEKIEKKMNTDEFLTNNQRNVSYVERRNELKTVDRFEGLVLDYYNFKEKPLMGYGQIQNSYMYKNISPNIITSNGLMSYLAEMGIIVTIIYFILLAQSSKYISQEFGYGINFLYMAVFLVVSISYAFGHLAMFNAIAFMAFFNSKKNLKQKHV